MYIVFLLAGVVVTWMASMRHTSRMTMMVAALIEK